MKKAILIAGLALIAFSCKRKYICDCRTETAIPSIQNSVYEEKPPKHLIENWQFNCENQGCLWYEKP